MRKASPNCQIVAIGHNSDRSNGSNRHCLEISLVQLRLDARRLSLVQNLEQLAPKQAVVNEMLIANVHNLDG